MVKCILKKPSRLPDIGYPVMLETSAGDGGKGIRKVESEDLVAAFGPSSEAQAAFKWCHVHGAGDLSHHATLEEF